MKGYCLLQKAFVTMLFASACAADPGGADTSSPGAGVEQSALTEATPGAKADAVATGGQLATPPVFVDGGRAPGGQIAAGATGRIGPGGKAVRELSDAAASRAVGGPPPGLINGHSAGGTVRGHLGLDTAGGAASNGAGGPFLNPGGSCTYNISAHGGRILPSPKVHRLFWGDYWTQAAHTAEASDYDTTWANLANDPAFYTRMSEYGVGPGSSGNRWNLTGVPTGSISEATITAQIQSTLSNASYFPSSNDLFVVFLPAGTTNQVDTSNSFSGHHDHFAWSFIFFSFDVAYAVIEYSTDRNYTNPVVSHEISEAATDPDLNAYWDSTPGNGGTEIGDICRFVYNNIAGQQVETTYSQRSCRCVRERELDNLDYAGAGHPTLTVFRSGTWYGNGASSYWNFGQAGDKPLPGDYNGDGKTEYALFRPSNGAWYILDTASGFYNTYFWGVNGDIPVPGDYDGDGITDKAVWRPSNGTWYIWKSSTNTSDTVQWGTSGDIPVPADYDGDGKIDIAVRRPSTSTWYVLPTTTPGSYTWASWGNPSDTPVVGDYNGDGKADWTLFRPSEGRFYVWYKDTGSAFWYGWGTSGDIPVVRDFDGDWKSDIAIWRPSDGNWFVLNSGGGSSVTQWGTSGDIPVLRNVQP
ncbi:MAG TPA: VCBS repeat-containing protein [Kofleriaceae bacterium]|jgi:hypothetical protein